VAIRRCEQCNQPVETSVGRWGGAVICPHCQHVTICPPEPDAQENTRQRPGRSNTPTLWVAIGLICLAAGGWLVWSTATATRVPASALGPDASPADRLQEQILRRNIDKPGDPELGVKFQTLNTRHFKGALPNIPVVWEAELDVLASYAGPCSAYCQPAGDSR
jgi:hypothetical protein